MKKHYISLGYFCSTARELERLGLRSESSPFDWLITDFEGVILAIENNFDDFLEYKYLAQSRKNRAYYRNTKYDFWFYHDFKPRVPLCEQLPIVQEKYKRRIERFKQSVQEPTLFVRYISDEQLVNGVSKELCYIEENYESILRLIKSFNKDNEILFIANEGVSSSKIFIHHVKKNKNDTVNRAPIVSTPELLELFNSFDYPQRQRNIQVYKQKTLQRSLFECKKLFRKLDVFPNKYIHENQC